MVKGIFTAPVAIAAASGTTWGLASVPSMTIGTASSEIDCGRMGHQMDDHSLALKIDSAVPQNRGAAGFRREVIGRRNATVNVEMHLEAFEIGTVAAAAEGNEPAAVEQSHC